jgi:hypothetical protein
MMVLSDSLVDLPQALVLLRLPAVRFCQYLPESLLSRLQLIIGHRSIEIPQLLLMLIKRFGMRLESLTVLMDKLPEKI